MSRKFARKKSSETEPVTKSDLKVPKDNSKTKESKSKETKAKETRMKQEPTKSSAKRKADAPAESKAAATKKTCLDKNAPAKPKLAQDFFNAMMKESIQKESGLTGRTLTSEMNKRWKECKNKSLFYLSEESDRTRYEEEMAEYTKKQQAESTDDLPKVAAQTDLQSKSSSDMDMDVAVAPAEENENELVEEEVATESEMKEKVHPNIPPYGVDVLEE